MCSKEIKCPSCGYVYRDEDMGPYISYWGEDGEQNDECPNCDISLILMECVMREFKVRLKEEGNHGSCRVETQ